MDQAGVEVLRIPQNYSEASSLESVAKAFRELRLQALKTDPASYTSSYATESQHPLLFWTNRLSNPQAKTFALIHSAQHEPKYRDSQPSTGKTWLGMLVLLGPTVVDSEAYHNASTWKVVLTKSSSQSDETQSVDARKEEVLENSTLAYHIVAVYVAHEVRGKGFAKKLLGSALSSIEQNLKEKGLGKAICTVGVTMGAIAAHNMYKSMGFVDVADETYTSEDGRQLHDIIMRRDLTV